MATMLVLLGAAEMLQECSGHCGSAATIAVAPLLRLGPKQGQEVYLAGCSPPSFLHTSIETEFFKLDGGAMFGVVPKVIWNELNPADEKNLCT